MFEKSIATIRSTKYVLSYVLKAKYGKIYSSIKCFQSIIGSLLPLVYTIFPGMILNELTGECNITRLIILVLGLTLTPAIYGVFDRNINCYLWKLNNAIRLGFEAEFFHHVMNMDYETYENPEIQAKQNRACNVTDSFLQIVDDVYSLIGAVITLFSITMIISSLNILIVVFVSIVILLNTMYARHNNKKVHDMEIELSKYDNYNGAYSYMLNYPEYGKEIRLFNIGDFLINLYTSSKKESNKMDVKYFSLGSRVGLWNTVTGTVQQLVIYAYLIVNALKGLISVGSLTIYLNAVGQFSGSLSRVFNSYLVLSNKKLRIDEYIEFMNIDNMINSSGNLEPVFDKDSTIEFVNVSFKYPGSEKYVLEKFNFSIHGNEKICIVGENGAGKSTFIKLLCRLYVPTDGKILLNGINIEEYDYRKYLDLFSPVFQDYARYYTTLEKNISLSSETDRDKLEDACDKSGLKSFVSNLQKGYDTQIGKWIDPAGIDPSGGEEQRMAIARACYHGGKIFLLDEPTASLDPNAEYDIYTRFNNVITDNCTIFITHRLSAVQLANRVAVFKEGQVVEQGTHKELYSKNGLYTEMFDKQAKFYRE